LGQDVALPGPLTHPRASENEHIYNSPAPIERKMPPSLLLSPFYVPAPLAVVAAYHTFGAAHRCHPLTILLFRLACGPTANDPGRPLRGGLSSLFTPPLPQPRESFGALWRWPAPLRAARCLRSMAFYSAHFAPICCNESGTRHMEQLPPVHQAQRWRLAQSPYPPACLPSRP
jgi:hypothetical protein